MLQIARLSPNLLGESCDLIRQFLTSQQLPDGGFADRSGNSDLYYTVFGLESFLALRGDARFGRRARRFSRGWKPFAAGMAATRRALSIRPS